jgi:hypothetical protein
MGASDIHVMGKLRDERYGRTLLEKRSTILKMAVDAVKLAKSFVGDVQFYAEVAGRSDPAYLFEMLEAVIDAGFHMGPDAACVKAPEVQRLLQGKSTADKQSDESVYPPIGPREPGLAQVLEVVRFLYHSGSLPGRNRLVVVGATR